jgi:hypothetical protein
LTAWWTIGAVSLAGAMLAFISSWRRSGRQENLGAVSDHWIAEHRFGSAQDSRR